MRYDKPTVVKLGSLADLTRQTYKQFGGSDGIFLQTADGDIPLGNVS
jgi:hypothetical protein